MLMTFWTWICETFTSLFARRTYQPVLSPRERKQAQETARRLHRAMRIRQQERQGRE